MKGYFFNAQPTSDIEKHPSGFDREYDAEDFNRFMGTFFTNGVFINGDENACKVTASGLRLSVTPGIVLVDGSQCHFEEGDGLTLGGSGSYSIMCRRNSAAGVRAFELVVVSGYPAPVRAGDIYEMCLARARVSGSTATVTDMRGVAAYCGFSALTGQPPYYPPDSDSLPYMLWLYTLGFPMTAEQKAAVEGNPSLMAIYNKSRTRPATEAETKAGIDNTHMVTPLGIGAQLKQKRNNDIRTYPVKAGESVEAGDVVDVVGGAAGKTWAVKPNEKSVFATGNTNQIATCKLSEGVTAIAYYRSNAVCARICNVSQNEISYSPEVNPTSGQGFQNICCVRISDTSFLMGYTYESSFNIKIGLVGSEGIVNLVSVNCPFSTQKTLFLDLDGKTFVFHDGKACVCSVVGTSITFGKEYAIPAIASANYVSATRLPDSGSSKRVCVCYSDVGDGYKGKAIILTISASDVVTWGAPAAFNASTGVLACCSDGQYVVITYRNNADGLWRANAMLTLGNSVTDVGSAPALVRNVTPDYVSIVNLGGQLVAMDKGGRAYLLTRTGTSIAVGNYFDVNGPGGYGTPYLTTAPISDTRLIACFSDASNSSYGTATPLEVRGDQIAGSFEDTSSQAIALQSGTGGQNIDLIFDGVTELPGITAGTSITSPGVQGYSPQDGWLWVKPEWDAKPFAQGSFVGTGQTTRDINLGFRPAFILFIGGSASVDYHGLGIIGQKNDASFSFYSSSISGAYALYALTETGFRALNAAGNVAGKTIEYIAFRE